MFRRHEHDSAKGVSRLTSYAMVSPEFLAILDSRRLFGEPFNVRIRNQDSRVQFDRTETRFEFIVLVHGRRMVVLMKLRGLLEFCAAAPFGTHSGNSGLSVLEDEICLRWIDSRKIAKNIPRLPIHRYNPCSWGEPIRELVMGGSRVKTWFKNRVQWVFQVLIVDN